MNFVKFTAKRISNLKQYRAETPIYVYKVHESEIKGFSLCNYFASDEFMWTILPHRSELKTRQACSHEDADNLLKNVPSELDTYVIDKDRQKYFIFCVALFTF